MLQLENPFTGTGQTSHFAVHNKPQWVKIVIVDVSSSDGVYSLRKEIGGSMVAMNIGTTIQAGECKDFWLEPGEYELDTDTNETGTCDIYIGGEHVEVGV